MRTTQDYDVGSTGYAAGAAYGGDGSGVGWVVFAASMLGLSAVAVRSALTDLPDGRAGRMDSCRLHLAVHG